MPDKCNQCGEHHMGICDGTNNIDLIKTTDNPDMDKDTVIKNNLENEEGMDLIK